MIRRPLSNIPDLPCIDTYCEPGRVLMQWRQYIARYDDMINTWAIIWIPQRVITTYAVNNDQFGQTGVIIQSNPALYKHSILSRTTNCEIDKDYLGYLRCNSQKGIGRTRPTAKARGIAIYVPPAPNIWGPRAPHEMALVELARCVLTSMTYLLLYDWGFCPLHRRVPEILRSASRLSTMA